MWRSGFLCRAACCLPASPERAAAAGLGSAMQSSQSVNMVSIHSADWRMCSQHWFHFEAPPQSLPIPSCVFCTQAVGDRARVLETQLRTVMVPYHCVGRAREVKGARPCLDSKRQKGHCSLLMTPLLMFGR